MTADLLAPFDRVRALRFDASGFSLLDQRLLPNTTAWLPMADATAVPMTFYRTRPPAPAKAR